jgi:hypothetical protein
MNGYYGDAIPTPLIQRALPILQPHTLLYCVRHQAPSEPVEPELPEPTLGGEPAQRTAAKNDSHVGGVVVLGAPLL